MMENSRMCDDGHKIRENGGENLDDDDKCDGIDDHDNDGGGDDEGHGIEVNGGDGEEVNGGDGDDVNTTTTVVVW